jgi:hypothetical protein
LLCTKHKNTLGSDPDLALTLDGCWVAWAQIDRAESNLTTIDDFR